MITITRFLTLFLLLAMLSSCFTARPPDNAEFDQVSDIRQLQGVYQNLGVSKPGIGPFYLSAILLQAIPRTDHSSIDTIEVRVIGDKTLSVKARGARGTIKEEEYVEGKDFNIESGRIRLKQKLGMASQGLTGPAYQNIELGLDQRGDGKYSKQETFVGFAFLIPFAYHENDEVRFIRLRE